MRVGAAERQAVGRQNQTTMVERCKRCNTAIDVDPALSAGVFEGMHWLCFHLEFEHMGTDPDLPCTDYSSCPWWTIKHYEEKLRELGVKPEEVITSAIQRHATARAGGGG